VINKKIFAERYVQKKGFLQYPAESVMRFYNVYLKQALPTGRILDYGCQTANNSAFLAGKGYDVWGVDTVKEALPLIRANMKRIGVDSIQKFTIVPDTKLPFKNDYFDAILSNQFLYDHLSAQEIKEVLKEFARILRPGGTAFATMMGPKNVFITKHSKKTNGGYKISFPKKHRLYGFDHTISAVMENKRDLKNLFSDFECITIGYVDQSILEVTSTFHWIYVGRKA